MMTDWLRKVGEREGCKERREGRREGGVCVVGKERCTSSPPGKRLRREGGTEGGIEKE
jgi:hypothetical protein